MDDYAKIDAKLAASQRDIGESSNLAQLAQTYDSTFGDQKYKDYVCILSVLAQVAIDNAKRQFDIDLSHEIKRIKDDMDIKQHKYPMFWSVIKKDVKEVNLNPDLHCPMNYLYNLKLDQFRPKETTLKMDYFLQKFPLEITRKKSKKVEALIEKYSMMQMKYMINADSTRSDSVDFDSNADSYLLLQYNFDEMVKDIRENYISSNYIGLYSWLLDRAFMATPQMRSNQYVIKSKIRKNRSVLIKVLYDINKDNLIKCLSKNLNL